MSPGRSTRCKRRATSTSSSSQSVALDAKTEKLAANCWVAVGGSSASACNTGAGGASASGLPGLSALDKATGLVDAGSLVANAKDVAAQAAGQATGLATAANGVSPVNCTVNAGVPSSVTGNVPSAVTDAAKPVKLVVGIVIDQFRYDYLQRFADQFGEGGFRRLLNGGAVFTNANYIHTPTYTACGHATFMSGSAPSINGIIGNEWYDRASGKTITLYHWTP